MRAGLRKMGAVQEIITFWGVEELVFCSRISAGDVLVVFRVPLEPPC